MNPSRDPTQAELRDLLDYDPETGIFRWRPAFRLRRVKAGDRAGWTHRNGYRLIEIGDKNRREARLAWIYVNGSIPAGTTIDHRNGNRSDNRISNLRLATRSQQNQNHKVRVDNASGVTGVYWSKRWRKWQTEIRVAGKTIFLGYHSDFQVACEIRAAAEEAYFGEFRRTA